MSYSTETLVSAFNEEQHTYIAETRPLLEQKTNTFLNKKMHQSSHNIIGSIFDTGNAVASVVEALYERRVVSLSLRATNTVPSIAVLALAILTTCNT